MHSSTKLPTRTRLPSSNSHVDFKGLENQRAGYDSTKLVRSPSMVLSQSKSNSMYRVDDSPQPKIFPGIVHERARRGSVRQGSSSEKDSDISLGLPVAGPRPTSSSENENGTYVTRLKESAEGL